MSQLSTNSIARRVRIEGHASIFYSKADFTVGEITTSSETRRLYPHLPHKVKFRHVGPPVPITLASFEGVPGLYRDYEQLVVDQIVSKADDVAWVYRLIAKLPGVGPASVEKLRTRFDTSVIDVLDRRQVVSLLASVVTPKRAAKIANWWQELGSWGRDFYKGIQLAKIPEPVCLAIEVYLEEHALWGRFVDVKTDLRGAIIQVAANPFDWSKLREDRDRDKDEPLRVVAGVSLARADLFAAAIGIPPSAPDRVIANTVARLEEAAADGHVCLTWSKLGRELMNNLGIDTETLLQIWRQAVNDNEIVTDESADSIYLPRLYAAELSVASAVSSRAVASYPKLPTPALNGLDQKQVAAVQNAFSHGVSFIAGAPGTGKSRTTIELLRTAKALGVLVLPVTPTGRAASRLIELGLGYDHEFDEIPRTIHSRLLACRDELPPRGILLVDEASMLDIEVAGAAMRKLPSGWRIVFVGDPEQLPSVGPGSLLADIVKSKIVPTSTLSTNYRNGVEGLSEAIAAIRVGKMPRNGPGFELRETSPESFLTAKSTLVTVVDAVNELAIATGCDPLDVMIMSPRRKHQPNLHTSTNNLNTPLRDHFNPSSAGLPIGRFGVGDKVVHRQNDYVINRFNGDRGMVIESTPRKVVVDFKDDRLTEYSLDDARELLRLDFVSTVHSSQGGEAKAVLLLLRGSDGLLLYRSLVYTAISRAQRHCLVLTEPGAFVRALRESHGGQRLGNLVARLRCGE